MPKIHAEEDKKRKEEVELHNEAEALSFRAQKALDEFKGKIPQQVVDEVTGKIEALKKALESKDTGRIRAAKNELEHSMQHIGEAMAKAGGHAHAEQGQQAGAQQQHREGEHKGPKDDIQEAEVEIIDDNKP